MAAKSKSEAVHDDPEQSKRFIDAALEAGPDETGEAFERAFKRVAPMKSRKNAKTKQ
jgi:uncharacterized protein (DUF1778 family)